jgi:GNAT superfamily N-acetyltransferase
VVRNIHKAPFSISPPLLPINFSLLNEYILDKSDISLLGNKEVVLKSLQKGDIYFISQYKDRVIAYIWLTLQDSFISWPSARLRLQDKEIYCVNITTHNEYRGKGIIPDAIYKGFEILRQFGYQRVYGLILCKNRPSLRTAQRCGFSQIRRIFFLKLLTIKINLSINPNLYFLIRRKS